MTEAPRIFNSQHCPHKASSCSLGFSTPAVAPAEVSACKSINQDSLYLPYSLSSFAAAVCSVDFPLSSRWFFSQFSFLLDVSPETEHWRPLVSQLCPTLCDPMDCSSPSSSSMGFWRQEYWSGLPCPPPGYPPKAGMETKPPAPPALAGICLTPSAPWEALGLSIDFQSSSRKNWKPEVHPWSLAVF